MVYAFVQDVAASWEQYERIAVVLVEPEPAGLLLHAAGPTDEGFRTINVWESEDAWQRFQAEQLAPAIAALGGPARPERTLRDVHAEHVVFGEATNSIDPLRHETAPGRLSNPLTFRND